MIASFALALALQAAGENPEFRYWKSCKPGSTVSYKMDMTHEGQAMQIEMARTLKEVGAEKHVVERKGKMTAAGQTFDLPVENEDVKLKDEKVRKILKEGQEEIEVAGKKLKCRYLELEEEDAEKGKVSSKVWVHEDIPGGIARADVKLGEGSTMKIAAVSWEKK